MPSLTIRVLFNDGSSETTRVEAEHPNDALKWLGPQLKGASVSGLVIEDEEEAA